MRLYKLTCALQEQNYAHKYPPQCISRLQGRSWTDNGLNLHISTQLCIHASTDQFDIAHLATCHRGCKTEMTFIAWWRHWAKGPHGLSLVNHTSILTFHSPHVLTFHFLLFLSLNNLSWALVSVFFLILVFCVSFSLCLSPDNPSFLFSLRRFFLLSLAFPLYPIIPRL